MKKQKTLSDQVISYIEAHLSEPLNLEHIAHQVGYSKYHLSRIFTREVGCSLHQYLQRRRLEEAAYQLAQGNKPVCEIAFEAGYESQQAFTYAFKRIYLMAPLAYRRQVKLSFNLHKMVNVFLLERARKEVYREEMVA